MHTRDYRRVFAVIRRRLCLSPPHHPLSFDEIAHLTCFEAVHSQCINVHQKSLYNLVHELWLWNRKRFSRTSCLLFHSDRRPEDARIFDF